MYLFSDNPKALLNLIWLNNSICFGLRGRQDHVKMLLWGDIQLKKTSNKGNNKITELRTILQRESQNS
jgi:hypothetical protein